MKIWFNKLWSQRPGGLLKNELCWILLLQSPRYTKCKSECSRLENPACCDTCWATSQLQALDVSVNKPFKGLMKKEWMLWMQSAGNDLTPTGRINKASIAQVCDWILRSWNGVKKEVFMDHLKNAALAMLWMELRTRKFIPG